MHDTDELDQERGDGSEDNLSFASLLGVADVLESIVHFDHLGCGHLACGFFEKKFVLESVDCILFIGPIIHEQNWIDKVLLIDGADEVFKHE